MVALSTLRQLGVIFLGLGLGAFMARFFHLLRHAFFKALLFLTAGAIIHGRRDYQDLRLIGNRALALPLINSFTLISALRLIGLPFMSAFFSKELILETILLLNFNALIYYWIVLGVGLTALYSSRFLSLIFARFTQNNLLVFKLDEDMPVVLRMLTLVLPAILGGYFLNFVLQVSFNLRSAPGFSKSTLALIILLLRYLIFSHLFFPLYLNWSFRK
jgi:NADH-ubiquinone oxidoreductase chain 5